MGSAELQIWIETWLALAWASSVGSTVLDRLGDPVDRRSCLEVWGRATGFGLGLFAIALAVLGGLGLYWDLPMVVLIFAGVAIAPRQFVREAMRPFQAALALVVQIGRGSIWDRILAVLIVSVGCVSFLMITWPVTDGDALCYHLQVPKSFLAEGKLIYLPDLHETVYPLVIELLYGLVIAGGEPATSRGLQAIFGLVLCASTSCLSRPWLGSRSWWAGGIAMLVPAVSNGMVAPLNDVGLAAMANLALLAWTRWANSPDDRARLAIAGLCGGLAIGVKYPAIIWVGLLGLGVLGRTWLSHSGGRRTAAMLKSACLYGAAVLLAGGLWYVRAWWATGNPIHPFFPEFFAGSGLAEVLEPSWRPLPRTPWHLLTALGPMTLDPSRFDSFSHQLGPIFLMAGPGLLMLGPPKRLTGLIGFGFAFFTLALILRQSPRFLLAAVGPWSVGVAWLMMKESASHRRTSLGIPVILAVALTLQAGLAIARVRHGIDLILAREDRHGYLARVEPTVPLGRWIDEHLPEDARLIGQDHRGFYIPRFYTMELAHRRRTGLGSSQESAEQVIQSWVDQGYTHLVTCPPDPIDALEFDPFLNDRLEDWLAERDPIYERVLVDGDGVARRYRIDQLTLEPSHSTHALTDLELVEPPSRVWR